MCLKEKCVCMFPPTNRAFQQTRWMHICRKTPLFYFPKIQDFTFIGSILKAQSNSILVGLPRLEPQTHIWGSKCSNQTYINVLRVCLAGGTQRFPPFPRLRKGKCRRTAKRLFSCQLANVPANVDSRVCGKHSHGCFPQTQESRASGNAASRAGSSVRGRLAKMLLMTFPPNKP